MKVVLDTNVFISGIFWAGSPQRELVNICRDPGDNKFLNCAILGGANYLVSGDDDLLSLKKIGPTSITTPSQFLKIYRKKSR